MSSTKTSKTAGEVRTDDGTPSGEVVPVVEPETVEDPPKMSELKGVRYVGMADTKTLLTEDLEALGAVNPKSDLEWSASNGRFVSSDEINASTRDALLADPNFLAE